MYIVERFDLVNNRCIYMNMGQNFTEACEMREYCEKHFSGQYRIRGIEE